MLTPRRSLPAGVRRILAREFQSGESATAAEIDRLLEDAERDLGRRAVPGSALYPLVIALSLWATGVWTEDPVTSTAFVLTLSLLGVARLVWTGRCHGRQPGSGPMGTRPMYISIHLTSLVFGAASGWLFLTRGLVHASYVTLPMVGAFVIGGSIILSSDRRHALLFSVLMLLGPTVGLIVDRSAPAMVLLGCVAMSMVFVVSQSRTLQQEYWGTRIARLALERRSSELARQKERAEEAARLKTEFLQNVSHELRTPMNGVVGMIELVRSSASEGEREEFLGHAQESAEKMLSLVNSILAFTGERVATPSRPRSVEIGEALDDVLRAHRARARAKGLAFEQEVDGAQARGHFDPLELRQFLSILLDNAVKFTEHGRVRVDLRVEDDGDALSVHGTVRDTGIGIPAEQLEVIFEPFRQVDGSSTRRYGGLGIGLPVARELARRLGGDLYAETAQPGARFVFHLSIPRASTAIVPTDALEGAIPLTR